MELENVAEIEVEIQESGPAGEQGPPGLSAYEVYLVNGGTLSEKEWLESLKGETGKEGYTPVKGEDYFTEEDIASLKIPTKVSDLENDSGFISEVPEEYVTETELNNKGYLTAIPDGYATEKYVDDVLANIDTDNTYIGSNELVFAKVFDDETYPNAVQLFYNNGTTDPSICDYFTELLTELYKGKTNNNQIGAILHLSFPGAMKNGMSMTLWFYGGDCKFLGFGRNNKSNIICQYQLSFDFSIDNTNHIITVTKATLKSSQITGNTPVNDIDLTNKKYVDDSVATLGDYVDEQLANAGGSELEVYDLEIHFSTSSLGAISNSDGKANLAALVNHAYQIKKPIAVNIIYSSSAEKQSPGLFYVAEENAVYVLQDAYNSDTEIRINGSWTDGVFQISSASRSYISHSNYLSKTNTTAFTPTGNYHPATKLYVDNAAASAGEKRYIYLQGAYNINTGYNTDYPYFIAEDLTAFSEYVTKFHNGNLLNLLPMTIINNKNNQSGVKGLGQVITIHNVYEEFGTIHLQGIAFTPNANQINGCFNEIQGIGIMLIDNSWTGDVFKCTRGGFRNEKIAGYLSKTNNKAFTPTADYHPATKKYVDDVVSSLPVAPDHVANITEDQITIWDSIADDEIEFNVDFTLSQLKSTVNMYRNISDEAIRASIKSAFEKAAAGDGKLSIVVNFARMNDRQGRFKFYQQDLITGENINSNYYFSSHYVGTNYTNVSGLPEVSELRIIVTGEWADGVFNVEGISIFYIRNRFIGPDNTTSYTPTGNYHPATKKYVDDAITAAITTVLEAEY